METILSYFGTYTPAAEGAVASFKFEYLTTLGFAAIVIFAGRAIVAHSAALRKYAIPAPVVSGLIFSIIVSIIKGSGIVGISFDTKIVQDLCQNLFFLCVGFGFTYANALVFVLVDGLIFILLTITGLRKKIFTAIPDAVRKAIPAGIGLFIAFLGLQNVGLVAKDASTGVTLGSFNLFNNASVSWATVVVTMMNRTSTRANSPASTFSGLM